jgi:hypothetical protein
MRVTITMEVETNLDEPTLERRLESRLDPVDLNSDLDVDESIELIETEIDARRIAP